MFIIGEDQDQGQMIVEEGTIEMEEMIDVEESPALVHHQEIDTDQEEEAAEETIVVDIQDQDLTRDTTREDQSAEAKKEEEAEIEALAHQDTEAPVLQEIEALVHPEIEVVVPQETITRKVLEEAEAIPQGRR